jgi:hypothetical protein
VILVAFKANFSFLQRVAPKRRAAKSPVFATGSLNSHNALPRKQTHQIAKPTDTTTDTSEGVAI